MYIKKIITNTFIASLLCGTSISALASDLPFKIAVIQSATSSKDIASGDYKKLIADLKNVKSNNTAFEKNLGLCAAYIKTGELDKSESACTAAIDTLKLVSLPRKKSLYFKAVSLSNRGVSKYLNNDITGSLDDFTTAMSIDRNSFTKHNLALVKNALAEEEQSSISLSD